MQTAADWVQLLGYLFLVAGLLYGVYLMLPAGAEESAAPAAAPGGGRRSVDEWAEAADRQEGHPDGHARRVADLALQLAEAIGLPEAERAPLEAAALLHDVGVFDLPPALLQKPGLLSQSELYEVWTHAARGARRALEITGSPLVSQIVRWHHERWDGLGYPDGLAGVQIPLPARILRLAESAEAMLQARVYRAALGPDDVIAEINRLAGVSYDPQLARVFADYVLPPYLAEREGVWH